MDRQVYEQKINDQRFLIETLRAVDTKRKADITRMAKQIDEQNKENKRLKSTIEQAIETMGGEPVQGNGEWETGMFCGLEDRAIQDRYIACRYGYDSALEKVQEWIIDEFEQALKDKP